MMGNRFFKKSKTKGGTSNKNSETSSNHYYKCKDTSKNPVETDEIYLNDISDYVAIFNYDAENNKEISLKKNDPIELIKDEDVYLVNYCPARNLRTNETGLIPSACIALRNSLESQEKTVHYKITKTQKNAYYLEKCKPFVSVQDLIYHYKKFGLQLGGYNFKLLRPHPKETNFSSVVDVWEESRENIKIMERIGFGNFGEVNRGIWRKKHVVAVKTIKLVNSNGRTADNSRFIEFKNELEILKTLRHDKIVKLWCLCRKDQPLLLVTEYMKNGSLLSYLREKDGRWIDFRQTIDMVAQIVSGMWYLERSNCIHRDLAARNILVGAMNIVKIGNYDLSILCIENNNYKITKTKKNEK